MAFKIGDVIAVYTNRSYNAKTKYAIIVAESKTNDNWLTVFINSQQAPVPQINKYQPLIEKSTNNFLVHDSFVDCHKPVEFTQQEIDDSLQRNPKNLLGAVSEEDIDKYIQLLRECPAITNAIKKCYFRPML